MMMQAIRLAGVLACITCATALAAGNHPHTAPDLQESAPASSDGHSVSGYGDIYETTLHYTGLQPGETATLSLYLAEWTTNVPVSDAELSVDITGPELETTVTPTAQDMAGKYAFDLRLPTAGTYSTLVEVNHGADFDLIPVDGLQAARASRKTAAHNPEDHGLHLHTEEVIGGGAAAVLLLLGAYFLGHWQGGRMTKEGV